MTIFSIGHSTHEPAEFAKIAKGLDIIIDVRSHPTSRWEWWRLEEMEKWLPEYGFELIWMPSLGGWDRRHMDRSAEMAEHGVDVAAYSRGAFPKQRIGRPHRSDETKPHWENQGLYDYAWYTTLPEFHDGLAFLSHSFGGRDQPKVAIMCAENVYWKCHRSMIADALWSIYGIDCLHIKGFAPKRPTTRRWINHTEKLGNRLLRYPPEVQQLWAEYRDLAHDRLIEGT